MIKVLRVVACAGVLAGWSSSTMLAAGSVAVLGLSFPWCRAGVRLAWKGLVRGFKWWRQQRMPLSDNHGTARFVASAELKQAGLLSGKGLIIGKRHGQFVRHPSPEASMIVFAPQGAGKGVGVVIPNLLTHPGSVLCIDPKGENFAVTARRRLALGKVWVLSMADDAPTHQFNPLDTVVVGSGSEVAQATRLAELLIPHETTSESHWRTKGVQWLTGFILHVAIRFEKEPHRRTLAMVHEYASLNEARFHKLLHAMGFSAQPLVRRLAAEMSRAITTQEGSGILSSVTKGTLIYAAGSRASMVTSRSDVAMEGLFEAVGSSLFLQVPVGQMAVYAGWLRMMVGLAHHASVTAATIPDERPLFLLDEAATLGEMKELQETIGQGRAYHQKLFIYQDMAQLKAANRGWQSVVNNCHINMAFAVNDLDTAEYLSRRLGEKTVATRSQGVSGGAGDVLAHHNNLGQGEQGRRLMMPNEILHMDPDKALVSIVGLGLKGAVLTDRIRYHREPLFQAWCERGTGKGPMACSQAVLEQVFPQLARMHVAPNADIATQRRALGCDGVPLQLEYVPGVVPTSVIALDEDGALDGEAVETEVSWLIAECGSATHEGCDLL